MSDFEKWWKENYEGIAYILKDDARDCWNVSRAASKQHIRTDNSALIAALQEELAHIKDAARAVVERWHTPLWKDVPATAEYINALAKAIGEQK